MSSVCTSVCVRPSICPHFSKSSKTKQIVVGLCVWPSGSLMTLVMYLLGFELFWNLFQRLVLCFRYKKSHKGYGKATHDSVGQKNSSQGKSLWNRNLAIVEILRPSFKFLWFEKLCDQTNEGNQSWHFPNFSYVPKAIQHRAFIQKRNHGVS